MRVHEPPARAWIWRGRVGALGALAVAMVGFAPGAVLANPSPPDIIWTVAGNGNQGDGGPATAASLSDPSGLAVGPTGDLFIADNFNWRIRRVTPVGTITTAAGNGTCGFAGDGGPATSAELCDAVDVAVDSGGDLFIADAVNQRIRKVTPDGTITTVAGTGSAGFSGDGGPATDARLSNPSGVAVDSAGNLYIADTLNHRIREVAGGTIATVAGDGTPGFSGDGGPATAAELNRPFGLAVDSGGSLYIADRLNQRVRKVASGIISTVAGNGNAGFSGDGGPATSASLDDLSDVAVDSSGDVLIADTFNNRIRKMVGGTITTVAGNGTCGFAGDGGSPTSAELCHPVGLAFAPSGDLLISDDANHRVREIGSELLTMSPSIQASHLGTTATVTATVVDGTGAPVSNIEVDLNVIGGPNAGMTTSRFTSASGTASFSYTSSVVGTDTLIASIPGSFPSSFARVTWIPLVLMTGRAYGAAENLNTLAGSVTVSPTPDTGPVSTSSARSTSTPCTAALTGAVSGRVLCVNVTTMVNLSRSTAAASAANATILTGIPGVPVISASGVEASSTSSCAGASGNTTIASLTIDGVTFSRTVAPNTMISLGNGISVILDEQTPVAGADFGLLVNAIHLIVNNGAGQVDVVVASARSDIHFCLPGD